MEVEKQLEFLKQQCQNIDSELLIFLKRRLQTERRIVEAKFKNDLPLEDLNRDAEVLDYVMKRSREMDISDTFIHNLYNLILDYSQEIQKDFISKKSNKQ